MTQKEKDALIQEIEELKDKGKYSNMYDCGYRDGSLNAILRIIEIIKSFKMLSNKDENTDICDTCKERQYCSKSNYIKSQCWRRE